MNGILSKGLFKIACIYKCEDFYIAQKCNFITVNFDPLPRVNVYRG